MAQPPSFGQQGQYAALNQQGYPPYNQQINGQQAGQPFIQGATPALAGNVQNGGLPMATGSSEPGRTTQTMNVPATAVTPAEPGFFARLLGAGGNPA